MAEGVEPEEADVYNTLLKILRHDADGFVLKALKRITIGVVALVGASLSAHVFLFNQMTSGLKGQFELVKEQVGLLRTDVSAVETKLDDSLEVMKRVEGSSSATQSILVQTTENDIPLPESSTRLLEIAPIGGSGRLVVTEFIPIENYFPFSTPTDQLETRKNTLRDQYRNILVGQSSPIFDAEIHEIEVIHKLVRAADGSVQIWVFAYVVERE